MRKSILAFFAVAVVGSLSGCATSGEPVVAKSPFDSDIDWDKVTVITRDARSRGYDVVWVNPPSKKKDNPAIR